MRHHILCVFLAVGMICIASKTRADWNSGDPAKWVQMPDMLHGLDVNATSPKILADDFMCTESGPITDIHIWGSWLNDVQVAPANLAVSIYSDIPASGTSSSRPGQQLWPPPLTKRTDVSTPNLWGTSQEGFYDPNQGGVIGGDTQVLQYNIHIDPQEAFVQQQGTIYWLAVQYVPAVQGSDQPMFGWKTRDPQDGHFGDDAVWADTPDLVWRPLTYPSGIPYAGSSIDLAFVLAVPEPACGLVVFALLSVLSLRLRPAA